MGAKPDRLCNLEKKKIIDVQKDFVATFNWLKDFCSNLKGDADLGVGKDENGNDRQGVRVDTSVSDHPVIRLSGKPASGAATCDDASTTSSLDLGAAADGKISLYGFDGAAASAVPFKQDDGTLGWGTMSASGIILAGAGINITENSEGVITISAQQLETSPSSSADGETVSLSVVTAVRYDEQTHKFQAKTRSLTFKGSVGTEGDWTDVFEAVSHSSEHTTEAAQ